MMKKNRTSMKEEYYAYLVRLQRNAPDGHWRISLENAHTGEMRNFASERELLRFMLASFRDGIDGKKDLAPKEIKTKCLSLGFSCIDPWFQFFCHFLSRLRVPNSV